MTDQELKDLVASLAESQKKTDAQMKKTDEQLKKTSEDIRKLSKLYGGASNNQGKVAEEFFFNSLKHEPILNGIHFDYIDKNITRSKGNIEEEYDIILVNGRVIYLIEVKYNLHRKDMEIFLKRKYPNFIKLFPEYSGFEIKLAFASFSVDDSCKVFALEQGISLLQRRGKIIETIAA